MSTTGYLPITVFDENDAVPAFLSVCNHIAAIAAAHVQQAYEDYNIKIQ